MSAVDAARVAATVKSAAGVKSAVRVEPPVGAETSVGVEARAEMVVTVRGVPAPTVAPVAVTPISIAAKTEGWSGVVVGSAGTVAVGWIYIVGRARIIVRQGLEVAHVKTSHIVYRPRPAPGLVRSDLAAGGNLAIVGAGEGRCGLA
jgi:hypothetical protein